MRLSAGSYRSIPYREVTLRLTCQICSNSPADPHQCPDRIADRKFIRTPAGLLRLALTNKVALHSGCDRIDVRRVEIETERIEFGICRPVRRQPQMDVPAGAIFQNSIVSVVADQLEPQFFIEPLALTCP